MQMRMQVQVLKRKRSFLSWLISFFSAIFICGKTQIKEGRRSDNKIRKKEQKKMAMVMVVDETTSDDCCSCVSCIPKCTPSKRKANNKKVTLSE
ncbi:unnamed protein product [Linum tenue]|uniref:Secreted protein n=1 Tax=Linum tenue TaxID=586396 RepID=A0AAV0NLX9_9ROSI|nr:unnamed protein product [Linum tenue]